MTSIRDVALPSSGTNWDAWGASVNDELRKWAAASGIHLDDFSGSDEARLVAACAKQDELTAANMPPIVLPWRDLSFTAPKTLVSGRKIMGLWPTGQKTHVTDAGPKITLSGSIGLGTSSWWNGTGEIYDVYMSDFAVIGGETRQFLDQPSGTLYGCHFHSLSFNFMGGVFGNGTRKALCTQVAFTGSWTMNNLWDTQWNIGGSDCIFSVESFNNIGISQSASQTGGLTDYFIKFDSLEAKIGKLYMSTMNGWRGMLISGNGTIIDMHGTIIEGYKPTRINGLLGGPGPGSQLKITGGVVSMHGCKIGQFMDNPDASEDGGVDISGGEVSMYGTNFYGTNLATINSIKHTGGRLTVSGTTKRMNISLAGRPRLETTAPAASQANLTATYTLTHDHSMEIV